MNKITIAKMMKEFDAVVQGTPTENVEFWFARDIQEPLGYTRWENFVQAI